MNGGVHTFWDFEFEAYHAPRGWPDGLGCLLPPKVSSSKYLRCYRLLYGQPIIYKWLCCSCNWSFARGQWDWI